jgi:hypothetical protein
MSCVLSTITEVPKLWGASLWEALLVIWGGGSCLYEDILILNEIWARDEIYISVGTLLGWNIVLVTYC